VRDANSVARAFKLVGEYLKLKRDELGHDGAAKAADFSLAMQEGFMRWARDRHKLSCKTISTYLSYIKAGMRFAATPRLVKDGKGIEREVRLLGEAPHIVDSEERISQVTQLPRSRPRSWIPSDQQLAAALGKITDEWTFRYCIMALNTWARPEAICELSVKAQVRFDVGTVDLNPPGRVQNKKHRPTIPLTDNLRGWLLHWGLDRPIERNGAPVLAIDNRTLQKAAKDAGIPEWKKFTRYALRHFMNTRVRRVPGITVGREERAAWMGHSDPQHRITEFFYESQDPDFLENARRAVDEVMKALDTLCPRALVAPGAVEGSRLSVIEGRAGVDRERDAS
jgi:integrase